MVWNPQGSAPTYKHETEASAIAEAERLARLNRGQQFYVLYAAELRVVDDMRRITLHPEGHSYESDGIPF